MCSKSSYYISSRYARDVFINIGEGIMYKSVLGRRNVCVCRIVSKGCVYYGMQLPVFTLLLKNCDISLGKCKATHDACQSSADYMVNHVECTFARGPEHVK